MMLPRRMRSALPFVLALALLGLALTTVACGPADDGAPDAAAPADEGAAPSTAPATEGPVATDEDSGPVEVDPELAAYEKTSGISGSLTSMGSDTLNNLMTLWAEGFQRNYPSARIQIEGKGSSTAPPALIEGTAQLGPMSRAMKSSEIDEFEQEFGYKPTQMRVAIDALAVYVNKDNPLEELTLPQVDAMFSKTRACGYGEEIDRWGQVGLDGDWTDRPLSLYGRNSASGTYGYFKDEALCKGDFRDSVKEQPGSASVVNGVQGDLAGIGYSGIGYKTSGVKALRIARAEGDTYYGTDAETVLAGDYPLARFLYVYVNKAPNQELDPKVLELMEFILSREGQEIVVKDGYLPLNAELVEQELAKLR